MDEFQFFIPVKILFGPNKIQEIGKTVKCFGSKVLIVVGKSSAQNNGTLKRLKDCIEKEEMKTLVYAGVESNPTLEMVTKGAAKAKDFDPDVIVGLGGGSVLDSAKLISLAATHNDDLWEYRIVGKRSINGITDTMIPIVTVSTAAGTGSEITPAAIMTSGTSKEVFVSPYMFPKTAIIDPMLATTLSPSLTACIGIDAFVQGLEAFVANNATTISDLFAYESVRISYTYLKKAVADPRDVDVRAKVSLAALLGAVSIILAGVGAVHAMASPLSGRYGLHHGKALSLLLPEVMKHNMPACSDKFARLAEAFGLDTKRMSKEDAARNAISTTEEFLKELGLSPVKKLGIYGIAEKDLTRLSDESMNPDMMTNPRKLSKEEVMEIFKAVL